MITVVFSINEIVTLEAAKRWEKSLLNACKVIRENEKKLNDLDSACGDGDCGSLLKAAAKGNLLLLQFVLH